MAARARHVRKFCDASGGPAALPLAIGRAASAAQAQIGSDRYSSIVVDAATGNVLEAANPDAPRHPASLAKLMTLVHGVRGTARPAHHHRRTGAGFGPRRLDGALQARLAAGHAADGRGGDPGAGHQIGQRRGRRARRTAWRIGGSLRPDDDPARPRAGHEPHHLHQRLRPARPGRMDHRARPRHPGAPPADRFPRLLSVFQHPQLHVPAPGDLQP